MKIFSAKSVLQCLFGNEGRLDQVYTDSPVLLPFGYYKLDRLLSTTKNVILGTPFSHDVISASVGRKQMCSYAVTTKRYVTSHYGFFI